MNFSDIINLWPSARVLAEDIGESTANVSKWRQRNSIPGYAWLAIAESAKERGIVGHNLLALPRTYTFLMTLAMIADAQRHDDQ